MPRLMLASANPRPPARPTAQWAHDTRDTLATLGLHLETLSRLSGSHGRDAADAALAPPIWSSCITCSKLVQELQIDKRH
jgi:hypothetical protein